MSSSDEFRALRAAARGDGPPDTQRKLAPALDIDALPRPPATPTIPAPPIVEGELDGPRTERTTSPQTPPAKRRSSDQWRFPGLQAALDEMQQARDAIEKKG